MSTALQLRLGNARRALAEAKRAQRKATSAVIHCVHDLRDVVDDIRRARRRTGGPSKLKGEVQDGR